MEESREGEKKGKGRGRLWPFLVAPAAARERASLKYSLCWSAIETRECISAMF